jgi:CBS domain-containing protein
MTARSVKDLMTSDLTTVAPETSVSEAAERMAREDIGPLPVVEDDRLVGIVAQADVAREVSSPWVGDVVEDISRDNDS